MRQVIVKGAENFTLSETVIAKDVDRRYLLLNNNRKP